MRSEKRASSVLMVSVLRHGVEHAGEEGSLLRGDLGGWGVVGNGAVADGPDVVGALDDEVFVDEQAATGGRSGRGAGT